MTGVPSRLWVRRAKHVRNQFGLFVASGSLLLSSSPSFLPYPASGKSHQIPGGGAAGHPMRRLLLSSAGFQTGTPESKSNFFRKPFRQLRFKTFQGWIGTCCYVTFLKHARKASFVYPLETLLCPHIGLFWLDETAAALFSILFAASLLTPMIPE